MLKIYTLIYQYINSNSSQVTNLHGTIVTEPNDPFPIIKSSFFVVKSFNNLTMSPYSHACVHEEKITKGHARKNLAAAKRRCRTNVARGEANKVFN
jgi:hypothetical protein